jgi:hypothetical protein
MAARLNTRHSDEVRAKIQASVIIDRMTQHFTGKIEMTATQLRAGEILLDRSVPKLAQIQHTGADGGPVQLVVRASDLTIV